MKSKATFFLTIWMIVFYSNTNAQRINYGFKAGTNFSVQSETGNIYNNSDIKIGLSGGIFGKMSLTDKLKLQTELNYDQKGSKSETKNEKFDYLTFPILINYSLGKGLSSPLGFNIYAGPYLAYLLHSDIEFSDETTNESNFNKYEYGVNGGLGIELPVKSGSILLDFRLGLALNTFDKNQDELKNKFFGIRLGYQF